jgi:Na+/H+ antiporter NhaD and related arsenite permeases
LNTMTVAIIIFAITYVLLMAFPKLRAYIALGSAAIFVISGILPISKIFGVVDWNVLMMIAGTMGVVYLFIESQMPSLLADVIIRKLPDIKWVIVVLSLFAGIISAFVDNVATVLMVAPVALTICKKLGISPVKSIIAISIASNLQGAATLVGDTTSILLGGYANMNFLDFFVYRGKVGMFFVVEISAIVSTFVLLWIFRKDKDPVDIETSTVVKDYFPSFLLTGMVLGLIIASFIPNTPSTINGIICMAGLLIAIVREVVRKNSDLVKGIFKEIDYFTLLLLGSLFIVIAGITEAGVVDWLSQQIVKLSGDNLFVVYTLITWASVILSAFIDNIPYIATMLPVVSGIAGILGIDPVILYFGLLSGATLGGNLTPIGASANITGIGILRKDRHEVKAWDFMKISIPFTLSAVVTGYLLIWFIWS